MKTYKTNYTQAVAIAEQLRSNSEEGLIISIADEIGYATGIEPNTYNKNKIKAICYDGKYIGGCCVVLPEDISICKLENKETKFGKQCITALENFLENKGLLVRQNGNDLLVFTDETEYKIASIAQNKTKDNLWETVFHVSINMDKNLIESVCTKKGKQIGIGLAELNINAEEIIEYLQQNNIFN